MPGSSLLEKPLAEASPRFARLSHGDESSLVRQLGIDATRLLDTAAPRVACHREILWTTLELERHLEPHTSRHDSNAGGRLSHNENREVAVDPISSVILGGLSFGIAALLVLRYRRARFRRHLHMFERRRAAKELALSPDLFGLRMSGVIEGHEVRVDEARGSSGATTHFRVDSRGDIPEDLVLQWPERTPLPPENALARDEAFAWKVDGAGDESVLLSVLSSETRAILTEWDWPSVVDHSTCVHVLSGGGVSSGPLPEEPGALQAPSPGMRSGSRARAAFGESRPTEAPRSTV